MSSSPVPDWVPSDLPGAPGVYRFRNDAGQLLYVGKSVNLKRRVRGYFYGGGPDSDRLSEMLGCASEVEIRRTGSDLEARLLEARAILREQPEYNRALKNSGEAWYLEVDFSVPYPRFRVVQAARKSSARYFGPFRSRKLPRRVARLAEKIFRLRSCTGRLEPDPDGSACIQRGLGLCSAPCVKDTGLNDYREQMEAAVEVLESSSAAADVRSDLAARRDEAAEELAFEEAADLQNRIEWLDELDGYRFALENPILDRSWLLVLPHARPTHRLLMPVAKGRVLSTRSADWTDETRWRDAVEDVCYALRIAELRSPAALPREELVPSLIVSRWLEENADEGTVLPMDELEAEGVVERLSENRREVA